MGIDTNLKDYLSQDIVIVDYGMGNLNSVRRRLSRIGVVSHVCSSPEEILEAKKIILPGVGHFAKAVDNLKENGLWDALHWAVTEKKTPILGICLGMQLMANYSEEGNQYGFGWFDAQVVRFKIQPHSFNKVPHMGWNTLESNNNHFIVDQQSFQSEFYFVHSYHVEMENKENVVATTLFEYPFISVMAKENIIGVQFHPEKSHRAGAEMLARFCENKEF